MKNGKMNFKRLALKTSILGKLFFLKPLTPTTDLYTKKTH